MKTYDSFEKLKSDIIQKMAIGLESGVAPKAEAMLSESASTIAAGDYSRASGGISDISKMESKVYISGDSVILEVRDTASPQESVWDSPVSPYDPMRDPDGTLFSRWIENGEWMDLGEYIKSGFTRKSKRAARKFIKPVQDELNNSNIVISIIKRYLK